MSVSIIMLTGVKRCGKDTCGLLLSTMGYTQLAFADILKQQAADRYQLPLSIFYDKKEIPILNGYTPRDLCILEGTLARSVDPDIWAKHIATKIKHTRLHNGALKIVITDTRYQNEIDLIQPQKVIRIIRPGYTSTDDPDNYDNVSKVDATIFNDGTIEDLKVKLLSLI